MKKILIHPRGKVIIYLSIILVLCAIISGFASSNRWLHDVFYKKELLTISESNIYQELKDFEIIDGSLYSVSDDPWLIISDIQSKEYDAVEIIVASVNNQNTEGQVFYEGEDKGGFSEKNSITFLLTEGMNYVKLPENTAGKLRLDLTNRAGTALNISEINLIRYRNLSIIGILGVVLVIFLICIVFYEFSYLLYTNTKLKQYQFLFEELVKRDFKKKYKRTILGMAWSVISPLLTLLVMSLVFTQFFGRRTQHYIIYLFCGNLVFSYFNESTTQGMTSLLGNAGIFTKVNVPKYLFLLSKNTQTLINFGLTLCVFFIFCIIDKITFTWKFIFLFYPIIMLVLFNVGIGLILSALFVFFRDIQYLWSVFTMLLMYLSAIFYTIDSYSEKIRNLFLLNPIYLFIRYFRKIVIEATIPSLWFHLLILADVIIAVGIGCLVYKKNNTKFLYYV